MRFQAPAPIEKANLICRYNFNWQSVALVMRKLGVRVPLPALNMHRWRNWQTFQTKDLMPQGVWVRAPPGVQYFGPACTKAGGTLWQGDRGEFDSRLVHKYRT